MINSAKKEGVPFGLSMSMDYVIEQGGSMEHESPHQSEVVHGDAVFSSAARFLLPSYSEVRKTS